MVDAFQKQFCTPTDQPGAGSVLIVEDDKQLMHCLARVMEARGFKVITAGSVFDGLAQIQLSAPEYTVVDMRFDDGCGPDVIAALKRRRPDARAIILTGYGNIATAVKAVKLGAIDYLTKPGCGRHCIHAARAIGRQSRGAAASHVAGQSAFAAHPASS